MSLPASAGDAIAVSILIKDIINDLGDSRGSSAEYQEVIRELLSLDKALLEVEQLSRTCETTVELNALSCAARRAAEQCRLHINAFLAKIKSYNKSLGAGGSGSRLRDATKKVQWTFAQKDELAKFRTEVNGHASAINMLLITASISYTRLTGRNFESRLEEADRKHGALSDEVLSTLRDIREKLQDNEQQLEQHVKQLDAQRRAGNRLVDGLQYFTTLSIDLKHFMTSILTASRHSYEVLLDIQSRVPREFKPCWIQEPVVFTDALGRIAPIHLELINSWDIFDNVLSARFVNLPGQGKIARKEVAFQDHYLAKDVEHSQSFESCFLPGRHIDMSMIFKQDNSCTSCPKCGLKTKSDSGVAIQCTGCSLWLQRIEELSDDSVHESTADSDSYSQTGNMQRENQTSKKRKRPLSSREEEEEEDIRAFQRVRLLLRLREQNNDSQYHLLNTHSCAPSSPHMFVPSLESMGMTHSEQDRPLESREDEINPAQPIWTHDWSGFHYSEDWASERYRTHVGSSGEVICDALYKPHSRITPFPNPYTNLNFHDWLFGGKDTNDTGDNYLSTLLELSD